MKGSFLTVCMNPSLQKTYVFANLVMDTVNRTAEFSFDASGKGINVSRVLTQLERKCCHLTQLGGVMRPLFLELCVRDGLAVEWVESYSAIRFCTTLLDRGKKTVTELVEESEKVGEGTTGRIIKAFELLVKKYSAVIISGSMARGFDNTLIPEMVRIAKSCKCRVILDVRGEDLVKSLPFKPDLIKPNLLEFFSTFAPEIPIKNNFPCDSNLKEKAEKIWRPLYEKFHCSIVITRGADSVWFAEGAELFEYATEPVEPFNTTGSGDAFTAGLAAALEDGAELAEAVAEGSRCGALNAGLLRPGVIR